MKTVLLVVLVAAIAGLQFHHEYSSASGPESAVCLAPQSQQTAANDMLLEHMLSHR